ncbi:MAG: D-2-hydroxyacid dehydrogenase [bacterium]
MSVQSKWSIVFLDAATLSSGDVSFERFTRNWDCAFFPMSMPEEVHERVKGRQVVITNKVVIDRPLLTRPETGEMKLIAVAATGTNNVDIAAAAERGIPVCNVSGYSTLSVVQHTFGLIIELASHIGRYSSAVRNGAWEKSPVFTMLEPQCTELAGKKLGIIGYGRIGKAVAKAARGFGIKVLIAVRPGTEGALPAGRVPLDELLREADVVSVHCPLTPETRNLIDRGALHKMKPTAFLINVARGGIVDEEALIEALKEKVIAGAAVDVLTQEPPSPDHPMVKASRELDNLILTPHIAWTTLEARQRLLDEIAENITAYERGGERNRVLCLTCSFTPAEKQSPAP